MDRPARVRARTTPGRFSDCQQLLRGSAACLSACLLQPNPTFRQPRRWPVSSPRAACWVVPPLQVPLPLPLPLLLWAAVNDPQGKLYVMDASTPNGNGQFEWHAVGIDTSATTGLPGYVHIPGWPGGRAGGPYGVTDPRGHACGHDRVFRSPSHLPTGGVAAPTPFLARLPRCTHAHARTHARTSLHAGYDTAVAFNATGPGNASELVLVSSGAWKASAAINRKALMKQFVAVYQSDTGGQVCSPNPS